MPHRNKLVELVKHLGSTPSIVHLNSLDFLNHAVEYATSYHGEKQISNDTARRVYAVVSTGIRQGVYEMPRERRQWFARHLYHRPARELGLGLAN